MGRDPFFDEDPELDPGELSDGIWAEVAPAPQGEMSPEAGASHEWVALEQCAAEIPEISQWNARTSGPKGEWAPVSVPTMRYRCRRCGRELAATLRRVADMIDLPTLQHLRTSLEEMRGLSDDWDGEGAPKPEPPAIIRAQDVLRWAEDADLQVFDVSVDTDVLGGVAVWICRPDAKSVWVSCMNNGRDTVVFSEDGRISASSWDDAARESVLEFLLGGARG